MFWTSSSSVMFTWPTATLRHSTFFIWNLMVDWRSAILAIMSSWCVSRVGNFPALLSPGPRSLGICLIRDSDARKASYFLASFLTSFFCLLSFLRSSALMKGIPLALASSQCCWSPNMHTENLGRGTCRNLFAGREATQFTLCSTSPPSSGRADESAHYLRPWVRVRREPTKVFETTVTMGCQGPRQRVTTRPHNRPIHSAGESLVLLGIVVLEADLQVDGLHELAFFGLLGMLEHLGHALKEGFLRYFTHVGDMTSARTTI